MDGIQEYKKENYFLINSYFYNDHDIKLMADLTQDGQNKWDHFIILYKNILGKLKFIRKDYTYNNNKFTIHDLPDDKYFIYPIRAILVPNKGRGNKYDVKNLNMIPDKDWYNIACKQIFW